MTVKRKVPRFWVGAICGWNFQFQVLFQPSLGYPLLRHDCWNPSCTGTRRPNGSRWWLGSGTPPTTAEGTHVAFMIHGPPADTLHPRAVKLPRYYIVVRCHEDARLCPPSKHETFTQGWFNVGPSLTTLGQHWSNLWCLLGIYIINPSSPLHNITYSTLYAPKQCIAYLNTDLISFHKVF